MERQRKYSGRYCIAYNCLNNNKKIPDLSLFKLPKDADRRHEWLTAIGREDLLSLENLKHNSYEVCCAHFDDSCIRTLKQLKPDAVPSADPVNIKAKTKKIARKPPTKKTKAISIQTETMMCFNATTQTEDAEASVKTELLKRRLTQNSSDSDCKRRRSDFEARIKVEVEECDPFALDTNDNVSISHSEERCSILSETKDAINKRIENVIDWQNNLKNTRSEDECRAFALNLLYYSPDAYRCFQSVLKLPSKIALNKLKLKIQPKLDDRFLSSLAMRIKALPERAKYCSICVNQIDLKRNLCYDAVNDEMFGFHNIDGILSTEVASNAYVIMLQGLYFKWEQPIGYAFLANTQHYDELDMWMNEVIGKLFDQGIDVRAVISNQESNFDTYAKEIRNVTIDRPYFFVDGRKMYYIFDVPNLLNALRDTLISNDFYFDGQLISWEFIRELYDDQKYRHLQLISKITDAHIDPNSAQRKRLKYAAQIFSKSVAAALDMYVEFDKIPHKALPTATFIKNIDELFDVLNISKSAKNQAGFTMSRNQLSVLEEAQNMFSSIESVDRNTGQVHINLKVLQNFQISIQSVIQLYEDLKEEGFHYLYTRRLNQDSLDKFLGALKQQVGSCDLTPIKFTRAFSKLFLTKLINSPTRNETDIFEMLQKTEEVMRIFDSAHPAVEVKTSQVQLPGETDFRMDFPEVNALIYVAGYLIYKCATKHNCDDMEAEMKSLPGLNQSALYAHYKEYNKNASFYGNLKIPPQEIIQFVDRLETAFTHNFEKCIQNRPGNTIYEILKAIPSARLCSCFPLDYFIKLFVRLRIFATLRFNNRSFKAGKRSSGLCLKVKQLSTI